ncbi:hypothetical protein BBK82_27450 [Lentzea guizhouensis]|uniref:Uncharacterized protein n=1 Tax=Lentzea guizhouensis TaxID=1586287 RepID=A0A1B2HND5_9PSEU|nr:hypothetical protein BBK82_27450 [Lentzea guizhouensis]
MASSPSVVRRTDTSWRSSSSVRVDSVLIVVATCLCSALATAIRRAPACIAMRLTWCDTTSCISRAKRARSSARTACACRTRSRSRDSASSAMRSASCWRAWASKASAMGRPAIITPRIAECRWAYQGNLRKSSGGHSAERLSHTSTPAASVCQPHTYRRATAYRAIIAAICAQPKKKPGMVSSATTNGNRRRSSSTAAAVQDSHSE